ncbi:MAG: heavy-metal-associated domain-containing protein [Pseudomonadota bacterium]
MYQLQVEGMSCGGCVKSVTRCVQAIDPGAKVDVDLNSKTVRIDSGAGLDVLRAALSEAGYPVTAATGAA